MNETGREMMKNSDMPAMPMLNKKGFPSAPCEIPQNHASGLSKREHFAAMALNTVLSSYNPYDCGNFDCSDWDTAAFNAVGLADALLAALEADDE